MNTEFQRSNEYWVRNSAGNITSRCFYWNACVYVFILLAHLFMWLNGPICPYWPHALGCSFNNTTYQGTCMDLILWRLENTMRGQQNHRGYEGWIFCWIWFLFPDQIKLNFGTDVVIIFQTNSGAMFNWANNSIILTIMW